MIGDIRYKYTKIIPLEVCVKEPNFNNFIEKLIDRDISITTQPHVSDSNDTCMIDMSFQMSDENNDVLFKIKLRHIFIFENFNPKPFLGLDSKSEKDEIFDFFVMILSVSYSSSRGYIAALLSNYRFKELDVLPVIDPLLLLNRKDE